MKIHHHGSTHRSTALWVMALCLTHGAMAEEPSPVTPGRPSVSSAAQLPAAGQLEMELGGLRQVSTGSARNSLPYQLKLALSSEWGLAIGGEAYIASTDADTSNASAGDTSLLLKRVWTVNDVSSAGLEFSIKSPTAGNSLGSGKTDYTLNAIYSRDFGAIHMDANLNATSLGLEEAGLARTATGWSASFSTALSDTWGLTSEVSGVHRDGTADSTQFLGALTFSPNKQLVFDFGFVRAYATTPGSTSVFAGVVFPIATLW